MKRTIRILYGKPKSAERTIPMNLTVHNLLSDLRKCWSSELAIPSNRKPGEKILDLKKGFKKAVRLAKLQTKIRFHDLRHTFASRFVDGGANIVTVQHLLGHARISMTARYAHSPDATKIAAVEKLDGLFNSKSSPQSAPRGVNEGDRELNKTNQVNTLGS